MCQALYDQFHSSGLAIDCLPSVCFSTCVICVCSRWTVPCLLGLLRLLVSYRDPGRDLAFFFSSPVSVDENPKAQKEATTKPQNRDAVKTEVVRSSLTVKQAGPKLSVFLLQPPVCRDHVCAHGWKGNHTRDFPPCLLSPCVSDVLHW